MLPFNLFLIVVHIEFLIQMSKAWCLALLLSFCLFEPWSGVAQAGLELTVYLQITDLCSSCSSSFLVLGFQACATTPSLCTLGTEPRASCRHPPTGLHPARVVFECHVSAHRVVDSEELGFSDLGYQLTLRMRFSKKLGFNCFCSDFFQDPRQTQYMFF